MYEGIALIATGALASIILITVVYAAGRRDGQRRAAEAHMQQVAAARRYGAAKLREYVNLADNAATRRATTQAIPPAT